MSEPLPTPIRPTEPALAAPPRRRRSRAPWVALLLLALAAGGGWYAWSQRGAASDPSAGTPGASGGPGGPGGGNGRRFAGGRAQPVSAQAARQQDVRVTVSAIGTIAALNTATVRSRVEGELRRLHFTEGQQVRAGQLLAEIDPRAYEVALAQAQGTLARDAAQLRNAELDLARYRELLAQDSIAKQQVDTQEALVRQLQGTVQTDQAAVDNARLQLSYTRITAPIAGRLGLRQVDLGNVVRASDTTGLVTITQTQPIAVVFAVPETHLPKINRQLQANQPLAVEAWDREQRNRLAQGRVKTTDNAIDTATGTIKLKAEFGNADGALFPNQFVNIRLQLDTLPNALVVPVTAIQRGSVGTFVYLIQEDGSVTIRRVTLGATDGDWVHVQGEVQPGDRLVTDGADRLREGAKVEVITPANRRPAGGASASNGSGGKDAAPSGGSPRAEGRAPAGPAASAPTASAKPAQAGAASAATAGASGASDGGPPPWFDRLPPEVQERYKKMNPDERRDFIEKLRERRRQREAQGG